MSTAENTTYPGENKFLHIFNPPTLAKSFLSCFSLKTGARVFAILFLFIDITDIIVQFNLLEILIMCLHLLASVMILYSTFTQEDSKYKWAFKGYFILVIYFWLDVLSGIIACLFTICKYFYLLIKNLIIKQLKSITEA